MNEQQVEVEAAVADPQMALATHEGEAGPQRLFSIRVIVRKTLVYAALISVARKSTK